MQTIRIVIADGRTKSVEIKEIPAPKTKREISNLLHSMPKRMLAYALGMKVKGDGVRK